MATTENNTTTTNNNETTNTYEQWAIVAAGNILQRRGNPLVFNTRYEARSAKRTLNITTGAVRRVTANFTVA